MQHSPKRLALATVQGCGVGMCDSYVPLRLHALGQRDVALKRTSGRRVRPDTGQPWLVK